MRTYMLFLLVLVPSVLSWTTSDRYNNFKNQHVNQDMTQAHCDNVISNRSITQSINNQCKPTNTFIKARLSDIVAVCDRAGTPYNNSRYLRLSNQPFPIVMCRRRNNNNLYPPCYYNGVYLRTVYIVIGCENRLPVHFDQYVPTNSG